MASIIVAGNGVSLLEHPRSFLESRPLFGMNYLPYYTDLKIDYWTAWDAKCLEDNLGKLKSTTGVVLPDKHRNFLTERDIVSSYINFVVPHPRGRNFSSSMLWTLYLIDQMMPEYREILVVGFDCTVGNGVYMGKGKGSGPHFYDPKGGGGIVRYAEVWDQQMSSMKDLLASTGKVLINISPGSKAKLFPPQDWRDYV